MFHLSIFGLSYPFSLDLNKMVSFGQYIMAKRKASNNNTFIIITFYSGLTKQREKNKRFESLNKYENTLNFKLLKTEKQYIMSNKELLSSRNRWHRNLTKDLYLEEGVKALEMLSLLDKNIILANNDKLLK